MSRAPAADVAAPLPGEPRVTCGVSDAQCAMAANLCRWPRPEITYAVGGYLPEFSRELYRSLVREAFDRWQAVCGLVAAETDSVSAANILLGAGRGRRSGFDGPSGVLAWAELPCGNPRQVRLQMDLDENWSTALEPGQASILVVNVLCHEIGHAIGLPHIAASRGIALMNPTYSPRVDRPLDLDAADGRARYGAPRPRPPAPSPSPAPPAEPAPAPPGAPGVPGRTPIELRVGGVVQWRAFVEDLAGVRT